MIISMHVIIIIYVGCSFGQPTKKCSLDICDGSVCTDYPDAVCYRDECTDCSPRYFIGNTEVTNVCGKFLVKKANYYLDLINSISLHFSRQVFVVTS